MGGEESARSVRDRLAEPGTATGRATTAGRLLAVAMGAFAAALVAANALSLVEGGVVAAGLSGLAAVAVVVGTGLVFEAGRRLGTTA